MAVKSCLDEAPQWHFRKNNTELRITVNRLFGAKMEEDELEFVADLDAILHLTPEVQLAIEQVILIFYGDFKSFKSFEVTCYSKNMLKLAIIQNC